MGPHENGILYRISIVARAQTFLAEPIAVIKADGRDVGGADFEGEAAAVVCGCPVQDCFEQGGADALPASVRVDGHGIQFAAVLGIFGAGRVEQEAGGSKSCDAAGEHGDERGAEQRRLGRAEVTHVVRRLPLGRFRRLGGDREDHVEVLGLHRPDRGSVHG
jgi:hypothetical protein